MRLLQRRWTVRGSRIRVTALSFIELVFLITATAAFAPSAQALPSFARQTGQPCGTCHTDFPALTPYGRRFKLLGYTTGGGEFRTTPFSSQVARDARAEYEKMMGYVKALPQGSSTRPEEEKEYVPPVSMMAIVGLTHTQAPQAPPTDPYKPNDNVVLSPISGFYGGAITENIGAFSQVTYNGVGVGAAVGFGDQFSHHTWTWDNTDVRYANTAHFGPLDIVYGITANNNPTVQDLWNSTPAWFLPQAGSTIAPTPGTKTLIEGAWAAHVGGVGGYAMFNDTLYVELTGYKTLPFSVQNNLGTDPFGAGQLGSVAPYWRIALEPHWGRNTFMVGTFGMYSAVNQYTNTALPNWSTATTALTDKFTDIGFDTQYQYQGDNWWLTLRGSYIREYQQLDATFASLGSLNPTNLLNSLKLQASFAYGGDNRVVFTGNYFNVWGSADPILLANNALGSPNSSGWLAEISYIPFGTSKAVGWPWFNTRISLQYIFYDKFNGTSVGAHDNNTVWLGAWFAM